MERSGESFLEIFLSEVCVCVLGFGRVQERGENEESACMEIWEMHGCMSHFCMEIL